MLTEGGIVGLAFALLALTQIARLGLRARDSAPTVRDRALVLGTMTSGLALAIQCMSDFPLHIPGVTITAIVLAAHLCRLGMEAAPPEPAADPRPARLGPLLGGLAIVGLSVVLLVHSVRLARAEAWVRSAGLPFPGALMTTVDTVRRDNAELNRSRHALEAALRLRPNWAEGHLRLGAVMLGLYSNLAAEWIGQFQEEKLPDAATILSDAMWLHGVVHSTSAKELAAMGGVLNHEPVQAYLVPAARCFLEARRSSPDLGLSHARLAEVDYLIDPGEPTSTHVARALRLTGYDDAVLVLSGQAAAQAGDIDLAARCWQKALTIDGAGWREIAVAASLVMTPEQLLEKVLPPGGRFPLLVADRLYAAPEWREAREKFLRASAERLPDDPTVPPIQRLWLEGRARARLGERDRARSLMNDALEAEPLHPEWRVELIDFLIAWGELEEASRQARIGLTLHPDNADIQRALKSAVDAYAQGKLAVPTRD
jgi:tetratricopeptide (TPR) repeat protein